MQNTKLLPVLHRTPVIDRFFPKENEYSRISSAVMLRCYLRNCRFILYGYAAANCQVIAPFS